MCKINIDSGSISSLWENYDCIFSLQAFFLTKINAVIFRKDRSMVEELLYMLGLLICLVMFLIDFNVTSYVGQASGI